MVSVFSKQCFFHSSQEPCGGLNVSLACDTRYSHASGLLTLKIARVIIRATFKEVLLMQKKLTVTIDEEVYEGLRTVIGPRKISRFIQELVRPHVVRKDMYAAYKEMAADQIRESEALEWAEGTIGDSGDEER